MSYLILDGISIFNANQKVNSCSVLFVRDLCFSLIASDSSVRKEGLTRADAGGQSGHWEVTYRPQTQ